MHPELVKHLIAMWCFAGMPFLGGGESEACCIEMEDSGDILVEDSPGCIVPEDC